MFKKVLTTLVFSASAFSCFAQPCNSEHIKAQYQITVKTAGQPTASSDLTLWRANNQVAHQITDKQLTEIWYLQKNQRANLTRAFERYQQAIEYQPQELKADLDGDWQSKYSLMATAMLNSLQKVAIAQQDKGSKGCRVIEHYQGTYHDAKIHLVWLPQLQLFQSLSIVEPRQQKQWQLVALSQDQRSIDTQFLLWRNYKTTDYADIGDKESDPFLRQMIHLGF